MMSEVTLSHTCNRLWSVCQFPEMKMRGFNFGYYLGRVGSFTVRTGQWWGVIVTIRDPWSSVNHACSLIYSISGLYIYFCEGHYLCQAPWRFFAVSDRRPECNVVTFSVSVIGNVQLTLYMIPIGFICLKRVKIFPHIQCVYSITVL